MYDALGFWGSKYHVFMKLGIKLVISFSLSTHIHHSHQNCHLGAVLIKTVILEPGYHNNEPFHMGVLCELAHC